MRIDKKSGDIVYFDFHSGERDYDLVSGKCRVDQVMVYVSYADLSLLVGFPALVAHDVDLAEDP